MAHSKKVAALASMGLSIVLAAMKVIIAIFSGSLSLLAEAADSVIDLVTDSVTLLAVRVADIPPDDNHPYGHARAEHLGALAQALLMIFTYVWVIWQSIDRIAFHPTTPTLSLAILLIVIVSIAINMVRVYRLRRAAVQFKSHALAASAANFTNDMVRSLVVLFTLLLIALNSWGYVPMPLWVIQRLDAVAAMVVALFALGVAWRIGEQAIHALMDSIPSELSHQLAKRITALPNVIPDSTEVRARFVGEQPFVEVTVGMPRGLSIEEAHEMMHHIEKTICEDLHNAKVLVHIEPTRTVTEPYATTVYSVAHRLGLRVHHLTIYQLKEQIHVDMDLELPEMMSLSIAHTYSEQLEHALAHELPCETQITVHLEPRRDYVQPAVHYPPAHNHIVHIVNEMFCPSLVQNVDTLLTDEGMNIMLHCYFAGDIPLNDVHTRMAQMEREIRHTLPDIIRIQIDPEICPPNRQQDQECEE